MQYPCILEITSNQSINFVFEIQALKAFNVIYSY